MDCILLGRHFQIILGYGVLKCHCGVGCNENLEEVNHSEGGSWVHNYPTAMDEG